MGYLVNERLLTMNRPRKTLSPQGFVIHSTANAGATAANHFTYFNTAYRGASAHYFVDASEIIRMVPEWEQAWHAGPSANVRYLSVEMCEVKPFDEVWKRTVWLVADACVRYGWNTEDNVYSHRGMSLMYKETDHIDPIPFLTANGKTWGQLLGAIDAEIARIKRAAAPAGKAVNAAPSAVAVVDPLIIVNHGPDERAAGYLLDALAGRLAYMDAVTQEDVDSASAVYQVGGVKRFANSTLLAGRDRFETARIVLEFINGRL